ncbi:MAG: hypothetical protein ACRDBM_10375 [Sporomusa sp.]
MNALKDDVILRLQSFGYTVTTEDEWMLKFCMDKVVTHIKNNCNVAKVPKGLWPIAIDMICGEFLYGKKASGQSVGIDFEAVVKSVKEGDTTITFTDADSAEDKYDALISYLMHTETDFAAFRRLRW